MPAPARAECGQKIAANFVLANDLTCTGDGLVVAADGITLDLGGKLLKGPGMGPQTWPAPQLDSVGVRVDGKRGVTVRNGRISEFSTGVYFVKVTGSVIADVASDKSRFGLYVHNSDGNAIRGNEVAANIYGLHLQNANDTLVEKNKLVHQTYNSPGGYGIYLFASQRNRIVENSIQDNVNWGIWFSEARGNLIFHNNVLGNRPQVSDNTGENTWHDEATKQGNFWGDYPGRDGNGDGIGDSPYVILGPGGVVDPYPFVKVDGWKTKTTPTIDTYQPAVASGPRPVQLVALAGRSVLTATPRDASASPLDVRGSAIALGADQRTVFALDGRVVHGIDARSGASTTEVELTIDANVLAANRDGYRVIAMGTSAAELVPVGDAPGADDSDYGASYGALRELHQYEGEPRALAASYKYNQIFVATPRGIDLFYLGAGRYGRYHGGRVAYTIPLSGPAGAMTMNGSGTRIYAVAQGAGLVEVVDTEQYTVVQRIQLGTEATALAVDTREGMLFAGTSDGILAVDLRSGEIQRRVPLPGRAVDAAVSPNGDELYVALDAGRLGIAVLATEDLRIINVVSLDAAPTRLLVAVY